MKDDVNGIKLICGCDFEKLWCICAMNLVKQAHDLPKFAMQR